MKKAVIVAFDKFTDIDIFLTWDLLNRVKLRDKDFEVKIVGTASSHKSSCGLDLSTHGLIEECNDADLVFFGRTYHRNFGIKSENDNTQEKPVSFRNGAYVSCQLAFSCQKLPHYMPWILLSY